MTTSIQLSVLLTTLVLGQDTVPDPQKTKDDKPKQSDTTPKTSGPTDNFFPSEPKKNSDKVDENLEELGKALGNLPPDLKKTMQELSAFHLGDSIWFYLGDKGDPYGDSIYILKDKKILRLAPFPNDLKIYTYDPTKKNWTQLGTRTNDTNNPHSNPQISDGIKAILESRGKRGWISPTIKEKLNDLNAKQPSDGTWLYYGSDENAHGDSIHILPNGKLLMLSANAKNMGVYIYDDKKWVQIGTRGTGQNDSVTFTPNDKNTSKSEEIIQGIQSILESRKSRNWKSKQDKENQEIDGLYNWLLEVDINKITNEETKKEIQRRLALYNSVDKTKFPDFKPTNPTEERLIETLVAYKKIIKQLESDLEKGGNKERINKIITLLSQNIDNFLKNQRMETDINYIYQNTRFKDSKLITSWADPMFIERISPYFKKLQNQLSNLIQ